MSAKDPTGFESMIYSMRPSPPGPGCVFGREWLNRYALLSGMRRVWPYLFTIENRALRSSRSLAPTLWIPPEPEPGGMMVRGVVKQYLSAEALDTERRCREETRAAQMKSEA